MAERPANRGTCEGKRYKLKRLALIAVLLAGCLIPALAQCSATCSDRCMELADGAYNACMQATGNRDACIEALRITFCGCRASVCGCSGDGMCVSQ